MTATLTALATFTFSLTYDAGTSGDASLAVLKAGSSGSNGAVIPNVSYAYGTGTVLDANGAIPVNDSYFFQGSIASGATKTVDLIGSANQNPFGTNLAFTHVKHFLIAIIAPDGIKSVQVGPRGVSNAWQGPWGGAGATVYETVYWSLNYNGPPAGIAVTAGTGDLFLVKNPGGSTLDVLISISGKK